MNNSPEHTPGKLVKRRGSSAASESAQRDPEPEAAALRQSILDREAQRKIEVQRQRQTSLINPLGETPDAKPCLRVPFSVAVQDAFNSRGQTRVFEALQRAAKEVLPGAQNKLPLAFYLALVSPDVERFIRYLPDVRMEYAGRGLDTNELEALVWGVSFPSEQQVLALIEEQRKAGGYVRTPETKRQEAQLACIKISGVVRLKALMHAVTVQLDRINPEGVWAQAALGNVPAAIAAQTYIDSVRGAVSVRQTSLLFDVAEILWNTEHISKESKKRAEVAPNPKLVVEAALEAAVLNRCGVEGYQALRNDVHKVLNPSFHIRSSSIEAVLSALNYSKSDPGGSFLRTLMTTADLGCHQTQMLKRACKATGGICEPETIKALLGVRYTFSAAPRPTAYEIDLYPEYRAQTILNDLLTQYQKIFMGNLIIKTAQTPDSLVLSNGLKLSSDDTKNKNLLLASRILAGIPAQELGRLLRFWDEVS